VVFGPNHHKFREAVDLKYVGGAKSFVTYDDFERILNEWLNDSKLYSASAEVAGKYVKENAGATGVIIKEISRKDINKLHS
jgi:3-deoxy-D-manno-octulosonic-acid transferase